MPSSWQRTAQRVILHSWRIDLRINSWGEKNYYIYIHEFEVEIAVYGKSALWRRGWLLNPRVEHGGCTKYTLPERRVEKDFLFHFLYALYSYMSSWCSLHAAIHSRRYNLFHCCRRLQEFSRYNGHIQIFRFSLVTTSDCYRMCVCVCVGCVDLLYLEHVCDYCEKSC